MDRPTCATCPFFMPLPSDGTGDRGVCGNERPRPGVIDDDAWFSSRWPIVSVDEWCGSHPQFRDWILRSTSDAPLRYQLPVKPVMPPTAQPNPPSE